MILEARAHQIIAQYTVGGGRVASIKFEATCNGLSLRRSAPHSASRTKLAGGFDSRVASSLSQPLCEAPRCKPPCLQRFQAALKITSRPLFFLRSSRGGRWNLWRPAMDGKSFAIFRLACEVSRLLDAWLNLYPCTGTLGAYERYHLAASALENLTNLGVSAGRIV